MARVIDAAFRFYSWLVRTIATARAAAAKSREIDKS
jgi:hypothetical protein